MGSPASGHPDKVSTAPAKTSHTRRLRIAVAIVLVALAAGYMAWALDQGWTELRSAAFTLSGLDPAVLILGCTMTLLMATAYHVVLLAEINPHAASSVRVALAYSLGQVVRYVPGKVMGVVFQVGFLRGAVGAGSVLVALLIQTVHEYAWTTVFCVSLLGALIFGDYLPLVLLPVAAACLHVVHRRGTTWRMLPYLPWLGRHIPRPSESSGTRHPMILTVLQVAVWIPLTIAMWIVFEPLLGLEESLIAALAYIAAAVISLLVFVVPSGLVVREAAYVWLGGLAGIPPGELLFVALVMRLALTAAELTAALLLLVADRCQLRLEKSP